MQEAEKASAAYKEEQTRKLDQYIQEQRDISIKSLEQDAQQQAQALNASYQQKQGEIAQKIEQELQAGKA